MSTKYFIIDTIIVAVAIFLFEWLYHGVLMMPQYTVTPELWRPMDQMKEFTAFCITRKLAEGALLVWLFSRHFEGPAPDATRFGLYLGLLMGISLFGQYAWLPIPYSVAVGWLVGQVIMCILVGIVLSFLRKGRKAA